ncbi:MAG: hypothetical protein JWQ80_2781 [Massilia sp.]|nr:hypothetical protein [Massilia sp.]
MTPVGVWLTYRLDMEPMSLAFAAILMWVATKSLGDNIDGRGSWESVNFPALLI